jgi:hypothetical protein
MIWGSGPAHALFTLYVLGILTTCTSFTLTSRPITCQKNLLHQSNKRAIFPLAAPRSSPSDVRVQSASTTPPVSTTASPATGNPGKSCQIAPNRSKIFFPCLNKQTQPAPRIRSLIHPFSPVRASQEKVLVRRGMTVPPPAPPLRVARIHPPSLPGSLPH